jgi:hypothetical protein
MLYAVVPSARPIPPGGEPGTGLRLARGGAVGVLYSELDAPPSADRSEILAFGEVLKQLSETGPALPVRFPTVLPDLADLQSLLRERELAWARRLAVVEGHVELIVHAHDGEEAAPPPAAADSATGRDYLMARASFIRDREEQQTALVGILRPQCREIRLLRSAKGFRLACLVPEGAVDGLREAAEHWAAASHSRRVATSGPWPPFSFTEEEPAP